MDRLRNPDPIRGPAERTCSLRRPALPIRKPPDALLQLPRPCGRSTVTKSQGPKRTRHPWPCALSRPQGRPRDTTVATCSGSAHQVALEQMSER